MSNANSNIVNPNAPWARLLSKGVVGSAICAALNNAQCFKKMKAIREGKDKAELAKSGETASDTCHVSKHALYVLFF